MSAVCCKFMMKLCFETYDGSILGLWQQNSCKMVVTCMPIQCHLEPTVLAFSSHPRGQLIFSCTIGGPSYSYILEHYTLPKLAIYQCIPVLHLLVNNGPCRFLRYRPSSPKTVDIQGQKQEALTFFCVSFLYVLKSDLDYCSL